MTRKEAEILLFLEALDALEGNWSAGVWCLNSSLKLVVYWQPRPTSETLSFAVQIMLPYGFIEVANGPHTLSQFEVEIPPNTEMDRKLRSAGVTLDGNSIKEFLQHIRE